MGDDIYDNLGFEVSVGFAGKIAQAVLGFVGTVVFARELGPSQFGGVYFLITIVALLRQFSGYEGGAKQRFAGSGIDDGEILGAVTVFNVIVTVVASVLLLLVQGPLTRRTGIAQPALLGTLLICTLVFFSTYQTLLNAAGGLGRQVWLDTVRSVLTTPLQVGLVVAGVGAAGVIYGIVGATVLVIPVTLYSLGVRPAVPSAATLRSLWTYARYNIPSSFVGKTYDEYDVLLLAILFSQLEVGFYQAALKFTLPAMFVTQVSGSGLMTRVANRHGQGAAYNDDLTNVLAYASLFAIPILFGVVAIGDRLIVTAYKPQFAAATPYLIGLALYRLLKTQSHPYRQAILGTDRPSVIFRIDTVILAANLIGGLALAVVIGPIGVVVATVVTEAIRYPLYVRATPDRTGVPPRPFFEQLGAGMVMFAAVVGLRHVVPLASPIGVGTVVAVGGATYVATLTTVSDHFRGTVVSATRPLIAQLR